MLQRSELVNCVKAIVWGDTIYCLRVKKGTWSACSCEYSRLVLTLSFKTSYHMNAGAVYESPGDSLTNNVLSGHTTLQSNLDA